MSDTARIILGRIVGVHGVRGWVKLHSDCRPREAILHYRKFSAQRKKGEYFSLVLKNGRQQGKSIVAHFDGINNRDEALALNGLTLSVDRNDMPKLAKGEFYWADIIGLNVINRQNESLGIIKDIFATGANDVLIVDSGGKELLIPFVVGIYIDSADFDDQVLYVDWRYDWSE